MAQDASGSRGRLGARAIYAALKAQIGTVYPPGAAMPSSRALAAELGVARSTVTAAYEQLLSEGFIESRPGARARVAALGPPQARAATAEVPKTDARLSAFGRRMGALAAPASRDTCGLMIDFRYGDLNPADFPILAWKRALAEAAMQRPERLAYGDPGGSLRLRTALHAFLWRARGLRCDIDQILIVNGSQQGLDLCARLLLDPGDRFVIENPCYAMARQVLAATGALAVPVAVDRDGLETRHLEGTEARLAYVTPSHQFPLGGVLPVARRHALLAWARAVGAYVVEDDYDSEYRYDIKPVPPLHTLEDAGYVIYLGTVSKTLTPTLRIGYLVVPRDLRAAFAAAKQLTDRQTPLIVQDALARLIESGFYERHMRRMRRLNGARRTVLLDALRDRFGDTITTEGADAGLHVVAWFRHLPQAAESLLVERARALGLGLYPVSALFDPAVRSARPDQAGLVMGYAGLNARRIERGVELLQDAVRLADGST